MKKYKRELEGIKYALLNSKNALQNSKLALKEKVLAFSVICLLVFSSCSPPDTFYIPLTESETLMFSDSLREAIQTYDGNFFLRHQDTRRLEERIQSLLTIDDAELDKANELLEYYSMADGVLVGNPGDDTDWKYVEINRIRERDGNLLVQIRVHDKEFTFDYYEFLVERRKYKSQESLVISDYFSYNSGQWVSEGIGEMAKFLYHTSEDSSGQAEYGRAKDQVAADYQRGNFSLGERGFSELPEAEKQDRILNRVRLQLALMEDDTVYQRVLKEYRGFFPGDMSIFGLCIEHDYVKKDYSSILSHIRDYEVALGGGDAYTNWMQGDIMVYLNQPDSAAYYLNLSIEAEPFFDPPLISKFYLYLDQKDYAGALETFAKLEKLGYQLENLDLAEYPGFLNSEEFGSLVEASDPMPVGK